LLDSLLQENYNIGLEICQNDFQKSIKSF